MAGIPSNDRALGARVRRLTLKKIEVILRDDYEDIAFQKAVILKLASSILPRINEHSGEDGGAIVVQVAPEIAFKTSLLPNNSTVPYAAPQNTGGDSQ